MFPRLLFLAIVVILLPSCFPKPVSDPYNKFYWSQYYKQQLDPAAKFLDAGPLFTLESVNGLYHLRNYFFDTKTVISDEYFVDRGLTMRQGTAVYFSDTGQKIKRIQYLRGAVQDTLLRFYELNGQVSAKVPYKNGKIQGVEATYDEEGHLTECATYVNDRLEGERLIFNTDGTLKRREMYKAGEYMLDPSKDTVNVVQSIPAYPCSPKFSTTLNCSERSLQSYLASNVRYPSDAFKYGIQGRALVSFVVGKDGQVTNIKVERGICTSIQQECIRIIKGMEVWKPGMSGDEPVKVRFSLPITFRLE